MIQKLHNILTGWLKKYKLIEVTPAEQKLSALRLKKCVTCPFRKESKVLEFINGQGEYVNQLKCTACNGCPCVQKSLVVEEGCPKKFW